MAAIFQMTFSYAFSWMKMNDIRLKFHLSLFLRFQLTIFKHWFRSWLGTDQATSYYLNQWWFVYWRIYASLGLNELTLQGPVPDILTFLRLGQQAYLHLMVLDQQLAQCSPNKNVQRLFGYHNTHITPCILSKFYWSVTIPKMTYMTILYELSWTAPCFTFLWNEIVSSSIWECW